MLLAPFDIIAISQFLKVTLSRIIVPPDSTIIEVLAFVTIQLLIVKVDPDSTLIPSQLLVQVSKV